MAEKKSNIIDTEDILLVWKFVSRNWLIILIFPLLAGILAYLFVHRLPDEYGARTELLLNSGSGSGYEYQNQIYQGLTGFGKNFNELTNQIRILQSHDLISRTLDKLDFQVSYYIVGRVKTTEIPFVDAFSVNINLYDADGQLLYGTPCDIKILDKERFVLTFPYGTTTVERTHRFDEDIIENEYMLRVERNKYLNDETFRRLMENNYRFVVNSRLYLIEKYKSALTIYNADETSIIEISVEDELAIKAKMFLDTLSSTYINYSIQSQIELNESTLDYIDRQLTGVTGILDSIETNLETYKAQKDILDLSREQSDFFEKLLEFESDKRLLMLNLESLKSLEEYLITKDDERLLPPSLYITEDEFLRSSLTELYNMEVQRTQSAYDIKNESPMAARSSLAIQTMRANILTYITNLRKAIGDKIEDSNREIRYYESKLRQLPESERAILNIQRILSVNEEMYVYLLEKKANTVIAKAAIVPQVSVIEVARTVGVVGPNKSQVVYYFLAIGFIVALIVAFIRTAFFDRIQNTRELKQITALPVIGGIPRFDGKDEERLVVTANSRSNVAESFRSLRTNLQYFGKGSDNKLLLLTSLHPGEGKTFCSVNTSAIIASGHKRVLLLDFDMHKPKVHQALNLKNDKGLSTFIIGRDSLEQIIQPSGFENFDVITAGPVPPNASELVLSPKVEKLLSELKELYDLVIVDTPPIMLISDSMVLMRLVDVGLFVMNTDKATKNGVKFLEELIETNRLKDIALVMNNIKSKKWRYYYNKYGYRYGYGYDYGYGYSYGYGGGDPKRKK